MNQTWQVVWNKAPLNHNKIVHVLKESFRKSSWKRVDYCEQTWAWEQILNAHYLLSEKSGYLFLTHSPHPPISHSPWFPTLITSHSSSFSLFSSPPLSKSFFFLFQPKWSWVLSKHQHPNICIRTLLTCWCFSMMFTIILAYLSYCVSILTFLNQH